MTHRCVNSLLNEWFSSEEYGLRNSGWSTGLPGMLLLACMYLVWARDANEFPVDTVWTLDRY